MSSLYLAGQPEMASPAECHESNGESIFTVTVIRLWSHGLVGLYICISNGKPGLDGETVIYSKNSRELTSFTVSASSNIVNSPAEYHITKNQSVQKGRIRSLKLKLVAVKIAIN